MVPLTITQNIYIVDKMKQGSKNAPLSQNKFYVENFHHCLLIEELISVYNQK